MRQLCPAVTLSRVRAANFEFQVWRRRPETTGAEQPGRMETTLTLRGPGGVREYSHRCEAVVLAVCFDRQLNVHGVSDRKLFFPLIQSVHNGLAAGIIPARVCACVCVSSKHNG